MKRAAVAGLLLLLLAASPVHAQDPTPTPFPTPAFNWGQMPTESITYTAINTEVFTLYPITPTAGVSLDLGLWDYANFVQVVRTANTVKSLGNQYHVFDLLAGLAIVALALGPLVAMIRARGQGGGE